MENKRVVAKKIFIRDLLNGTYIKRPGWEPSGVLTKHGEITRINIIGLVVSIDENSFLLDDGTSSIAVRSFEPLKYIPNLGEIIRVIGRVRENNNTFFIVPEIVKKEDKKWHDLHNLEIKLQEKEAVKLPVEVDSSDEEVKTGPYQKILNALAVMDKGEGVEIMDIVNKINVPDSENIIQGLIEEGEIFEISPGRVKVLN